jgi:hypothetical protein
VDTQVPPWHRHKRNAVCILNIFFPYYFKWLVHFYFFFNISAYSMRYNQWSSSTNARAALIDAIISKIAFLCVMLTNNKCKIKINKNLIYK